MFFIIALLGGTLLFLFADTITRNWLKSSVLPHSEIVTALRLIALIVALRWMCGLYKGIISGAERLVWLSGFSSAVATGRFVLVLPLLIFFSATPQAFFGFQLGLAVLELAGLAWMAYRLLPSTPVGERIRWQWTPLKPVLKFSLSIAFTSSVWVMVTQSDKLVLSKILPLADYGYFTVAVLAASGIIIISSPVANALMPRLTRLHAESQHDQIIKLYRQSTQLVAILTIPATLILVFFSRQVLWAWTGDVHLVDKTATVLSLYAAGYGFLAVGAFPYYLQYAKGDLRLHLVGNFLFLLLLIPSIIWSAGLYGMTGAGWAWFITNALYLIIWTPLIHRRFSNNLHLQWLIHDISKPALAIALPFIALKFFIELSSNRTTLALELFLVYIFTTLPSFYLFLKSKKQIHHN
ncbi:polysaccharide biosynthesis protein [Aquitalea sp. S1-19]|nr:polysaccharide biosynthesis protein [Aquitalea sp. S1-19]